MKTKTTKEIKAELQHNRIRQLENRWKLASQKIDKDRIGKQIYKIIKGLDENEN